MVDEIEVAFFMSSPAGCSRGKGRREKGENAERIWGLASYLWAYGEESYDCHLGKDFRMGRYLRNIF